MHIELVKDTCLFQQKLQFKNIERFSSFVFELCIKSPEYCQLIVDPIAIGDGGEGAGAVGGIK